MRTFVFSAGLLLLCFSSCKKEEDNTPDYRLSGLADLVVNRNPFEKNMGLIPSQLPFGVQQERGERKSIQFSVEALPAGLTASFEKKSGIPDLSNSLFLTDKGAAAGEYLPILKLQTEGASEAKSFPFKVTLKGYGSCASYFANRTFDATYVSQNQGPRVNFKATSILQNENSDTVIIRNFNNQGTDLKVVFDCPKFTLVVPEQYAGSSIIQSYNYAITNGNNGTPNGFFFGVKELGPNNVQSSYGLHYEFE